MKNGEFVVADGVFHVYGTGRTGFEAVQGLRCLSNRVLSVGGIFSR